MNSYGNSVLNRARNTSENTDEWYTPYNLVEEEIEYYKDYFKGKSVLCNCNDGFYTSAFGQYFRRNFHDLGLRKLVCVSMNGSRGYVEETTRQFDSFYSTESGDFRSRWNVELLEDCDIVCTNPPFSLFIELFNLIMQKRKKFLLICNQNAITYKDIFPYIQRNEVWIGHKFGNMPFMVPQDTEPRATRYWVDDSGQKWRSIGNAMWLTNIAPPASQNLILTERYENGRYPKYDNYDAIEVSKVADIPMDYNGVMGVPITYIRYHGGTNFDIVGIASHGGDSEYDLFKPTIGGKQTYKRILIKRKGKQS